MTDDSNKGLIKAHAGYSDQRLEELCTSQVRFEGGFVPWVAWESENSSFGKTFREWARYPRFLPLYFSCDHGVHWESRCWPNETESMLRMFFTWNRKKCELMRILHGKKSYHIPHPWVFYRKKHFPSLPSKRTGTLVFFPHSNTTTTPAFEDLDSYIDGLKALPAKYQPIVICLSFHDVDKGLHRKLRKYHLPLVTAGTTNSRSFVDRFYSLLYQFRYSSSPNIGSHTFYVIEAGVPFFLYGPYPEFQIRGSKAVRDGKQNLEDYGDQQDIKEFTRLKELLSVRVDEVLPEQYAVVEKYLGIDSKVTRLKAACLMWWELLCHSGTTITMYAKLAGRLVSRTRLSLAARVKW